MGRKKSSTRPTLIFLKPQQELFCRYYTQDFSLCGNATLSYAEAYEYKLDELARKMRSTRRLTKTARASW
jgi:hypothetical protein